MAAVRFARVVFGPGGSAEIQRTKRRSNQRKNRVEDGVLRRPHLGLRKCRLRIVKVQRANGYGCA
jgi:hypothetical protein